jgi:RHH-type rel operon transcriptional repressor/antitoxin RelB
MLTIRLPNELEARLADMSARMQQPKSRIVKEAIAERLEELEDYSTAVEALAELDLGQDGVVSAEEAWRELGLED